MNFNEHHTLCTFLITDAPSHGTQYHNLSKEKDSEPNIPEKTLENLVKKLGTRGRLKSLNCVIINKFLTEKMYKIMEESFPHFFYTSELKPDVTDFLEFI